MTETASQMRRCAKPGSRFIAVKKRMKGNISVSDYIYADFFAENAAVSCMFPILKAAAEKLPQNFL